MTAPRPLWRGDARRVRFVAERLVVGLADPSDGEELIAVLARELERAGVVLLEVLDAAAVRRDDPV